MTTNLTKHIIKPPVSGSAYCKSPFYFILNSFALLITTPSISLKRAEQGIGVVGYDKQGKKICWLTLFWIISHCCSYIIIGFLISLFLINAKKIVHFQKAIWVLQFAVSVSFDISVLGLSYNRTNVNIRL